MKKRGIYAIVNVVTNQMYIGSSINITKRLSVHKGMLKKGKHPITFMQKDWDMTEGFSFKAKLLEIVPEDVNLFERERFYIESNVNLYNTHIPSNTGGSTYQPDSVKEKIKRKCAQDVLNNPEKYTQARNKTAVTIRRMIEENDPTIGIGKKRKVEIYNEIEILKFDSIKDSALFLKVSISRIAECIKGFKHKGGGSIRKVNSIKGYKCKYQES